MRNSQINHKRLLIQNRVHLVLHLGNKIMKHFMLYLVSLYTFPVISKNLLTFVRILYCFVSLITAVFRPRKRYCISTNFYTQNKQTTNYLVSVIFVHIAWNFRKVVISCPKLFFILVLLDINKQSLSNSFFDVSMQIQHSMFSNLQYYFNGDQLYVTQANFDWLTKNI